MLDNILFVRHLKTPSNLIKRYAGQQDVEVAIFPEKIEQLEKIHSDPIILISPMKRCQQTLSHIEKLLGYKFINIIVLDELKERNLGVWENRLKIDIIKEYPEFFYNNIFDLTRTPPEGESFFEILKRAESVIKVIDQINDGNQILICSHNQLLKILTSQLYQFDFTRNFDFRNGKIYDKEDMYNEIRI